MRDIHVELQLVVEHVYVRVFVEQPEFPLENRVPFLVGLLGTISGGVREASAALGVEVSSSSRSPASASSNVPSLSPDSDKFKMALVAIASCLRVDEKIVLQVPGDAVRDLDNVFQQVVVLHLSEVECLMMEIFTVMASNQMLAATLVRYLHICCACLCVFFLHDCQGGARVTADVMSSLFSCCVYMYACRPGFANR